MPIDIALSIAIAIAICYCYVYVYFDVAIDSAAAVDIATTIVIAIAIIILNRDSFDRVPQKQQSTNKVEYYHIQDERNRSGILSDLGLKERNALSSPSLLISKKICSYIFITSNSFIYYNYNYNEAKRSPPWFSSR
jgi:hypothetical protein